MTEIIGCAILVLVAVGIGIVIGIFALKNSTSKEKTDGILWMIRDDDGQMQMYTEICESIEDLSKKDLVLFKVKLVNPRK